MPDIPSLRRSLMNRPRPGSHPSTASGSSDNSLSVLSISPLLALADRGSSDSSYDAAPHTSQSVQHREPSSIGWARNNDPVLYRQLVAEQQKRRRHGRHEIMACIATETLRILPVLLSSRPHIRAEAYYLYDLKTTHRLLPDLFGASLQQKHRIRVKVVNEDALDAALWLESEQAYQDDIKAVKERTLALTKEVLGSHSDNDGDSEICTTSSALRPRTRKVILNVTNCVGKLGGRWEQGSLATEEERLCFRTSLSLSLSRTSEDETATKETPQAEDRMKPGDTPSTTDKTGAAEKSTIKPTPSRKKKAWMDSLVWHAEAQGWTVTPPLRSGQALYTRDVLVVRNTISTGSTLLEAAKRKAPNSVLPMVSVITVAPVYQPPWRRGNWMLPEYARDEDRALIKNKMRLALRIAVANKHDSVVLGTFGCDNNQYSRQPSTTAANPANAVATCWREVLMESEFSGCGWFRDICFAVPEERGDDTYNTFHKVLHNLEV